MAYRLWHAAQYMYCAVGTFVFLSLCLALLGTLPWSVTKIAYCWIKRNTGSPFVNLVLSQRAVVNDTSRTNAERRYLITHGSETPKLTSMKLRIYSHVRKGNTHAKHGGAAMTWVVSANTWHVTMFRFLERPFFSYFILGTAHSLHHGRFLHIM